MVFRVKVTVVPVPEEGTDPVPVQPVQIYRTPVPVTGDGTEQVWLEPWEKACVPTAGVGEPWAELTVRFQVGPVL